MNARKLWSQILIVVGSIAMLVGALDPLEGSIAILLGSGLVALGTFLGRGERRLIAYRTWVFVLIAFGVVAMWAALSALGARPGRALDLGCGPGTLPPKVQRSFSGTVVTVTR